MKKVTLAVAATLAIATAVPASAGNVDAYEAPTIVPPVVATGSGVSPLLALAGAAVLIGVVAAGDS